MREIMICDVTMKELSASKTLSPSFRQKIEIAKLLDRLGADVIEMEGIESLKADSLRIKSVASAVKDSVLAVPVELSEESVENTFAALKEARHPRLQVVAGLSAARMEYVYNIKQPQMAEKISSVIAACRKLCDDVEFVAEDATRAERAFLYEVIEAAISAGAGIITIYDRAGNMLPDEFAGFLKELMENVSSMDSVKLGVACADDLHCADTCALKAVTAGADIVKAAAYPLNTVSLSSIVDILSEKEDVLQAGIKVDRTIQKRITEQIRRICGSTKESASPFEGMVGTGGDGLSLSANEDMASVMKVVERLGYDLSEEDKVSVYQAYTDIAGNKEKVTSRELDAIIASVAMQVPSAYTLVGYIITSGNTANGGRSIKASSHITMEKDGQLLETVCLGDGPIDASFKAIESIVGRHYEMDDFQIQSITEGHEAMGETVVKLRSEGKVYSGRGISTDVLGSGIKAYINALNKIVYEEQQ